MNLHSDRLTVDRMLSFSAQRWAEKDAIVTFDHVLSYRDVERATRRFARLLLAKGAGPGSRIAVHLPTGPEFVIALFGISRIGAVTVSTNPNFTASETGYVLADSEAEFVICRPERRDLIRDLSAELPRLREAIAIPSLRDLLDVLLVGQSDDRLNSPLGSDSLHSILYTSGTTGQPKGAMLSQRARVINSMACRLGYEVGPQTRMNCPVPMFHSGGMVLGCINVLAAGGTLIIPPDASPDTSVASIREHRANYLLLVPTLIMRLVEASEFRDEASRSPIHMLHGAAPMPTSLAERIFRELPLCRPMHAYGATEAPQLTVLPTDEYRAHPSATGRPLPGTDVWVADDEGNPVASDGTVGEIVTAGPHIFEGYLNAPENTASVLVDGIYRTGDLATVDADGVISIAGRTRDMIISGGLNVYAKEVEDVLHQHPGVAHASVFGLPDEEWGEAVAAAVVPREAGRLSPEELTLFCRERLASYKKPRHIHLIDALPLTPAGKVQKFKLVERFKMVPRQD